MEFGQIFNHVTKLKVKSVVDSLLIVGLMIFVLTVITAIFTNKVWLIATLLIVAIITFTIGLIFYCYFALRDPQYLRSESYQLRKNAVDLMGDNEKSSNPNIANVPLLMNPYSENDDNDENPLLK